MVTDGATLLCQGQCTAVSIFLQGCSFFATLHLLTLRGCDVVLGVDWLRCLRPILWDFGTPYHEIPLPQPRSDLARAIPSP
jgi:hypothetical protein